MASVVPVVPVEPRTPVTAFTSRESPTPHWAADDAKEVESHTLTKKRAATNAPLTTPGEDAKPETSSPLRAARTLKTMFYNAIDFGDPESPAETSVDSSVFEYIRSCNTGTGSSVVAEEMLQELANLRAKRLIHPRSPLLRIYDNFAVLVLMVSATVDPIDLAFYSGQALGDSRGTAMAVLSVCIEFLYMFDLVAVRCRTTHEEYGGRTVTSQGAIIRRQFLMGWLGVDIVAAIPFDSLSLMFAQRRTPARAIRLIKCLRLLHIGKSLSEWRRTNSDTQFHIHLYKILHLLTLFFLFSHWFACVFYSLSAGSASMQQDPHGGGSSPNSWVLNNGVADLDADGDPTPKSLVERYFIVLYAATLMLLGENMAPLFSSSERACAITFCFLGACLYAILFGQFALIISDMNRDESRYAEQLQHVSDHMGQLSLPLDLKRRVHAFYHVIWGANRCLDREAFIEDLSGPLEAEVCYHIYGEMVRRVPIFRALPTQGIVQIVKMLQTSFFLEHDVMIREGEIGREMYFMRTGHAEIQVRGSHVLMLRGGEYFGETAVIGKGLRRTATVIARAFCDVSIFTTANYEELCRTVPEAGNLLKQHIDQSLRAYGNYATRAELMQMLGVGQGQAQAKQQESCSEYNAAAPVTPSSRWVAQAGGGEGGGGGRPGNGNGNGNGGASDSYLCSGGGGGGGGGGGEDEVFETSVPGAQPRRRPPGQTAERRGTERRAPRVTMAKRDTKRPTTILAQMEAFRGRPPPHVVPEEQHAQHQLQLPPQRDEAAPAGGADTGAGGGGRRGSGRSPDVQECPVSALDSATGGSGGGGTVAVQAMRSATQREGESRAGGAAALDPWGLPVQQHPAAKEVAN
jgi:hypothetical protein